MRIAGEERVLFETSDDVDARRRLVQYAVDNLFATLLPVQDKRVSLTVMFDVETQ